ncbi:hypothetical protein GOD44_12560 [Sinorhizobium medicae]|nr:hypothetical protein [Sinorhizobium medicae]
MTEIFLFPKTAEEQEAERQLTEAMHALNAAIEHAAQCGFEVELRPEHGRSPHTLARQCLTSTLRLVFREGTCSQNLSRYEERLSAPQLSAVARSRPPSSHS